MMEGGGTFTCIRWGDMNGTCWRKSRGLLGWANFHLSIV
jgi:hypothetical protein